MNAEKKQAKYFSVLKNLATRLFDLKEAILSSNDVQQVRLEQMQTEALVQVYIELLDNELFRIQELKGANTSFSSIQDAYIKVIEKCIEKAKGRITDIKKGAVWDNLVIAFFGETNAGKSTIIETFRILYGEETRAKRLKDSPDGVDGEIVGTGKADFTQTCTEYKMSIEGHPFTLIDVPGIEGNEGKYEENIRTALNKAHYVFYIQGQNKQPDSGTAGKIKSYLRDWVKVYSVYNVREDASYYEDAQKRMSLMSPSVNKVAALIEKTFEEILGATYVGNKTLQAYLALSSKAKFLPARTDLLRRQKKLFAYFGDREEAIYKFSQFSSLVEVVAQKTSNFLPEIIEANKEKHRSLLREIMTDLKGASKNTSDSIVALEEAIDTFKKGVTQDFSSTKWQILRDANARYEQLFQELERFGDRAIEEEKDKAACEAYTEHAVKRVLGRELQEDIQKQIKSLNKSIHERKRKLDQELSSTNLTHINVSIDIKMDFAGALDKLDTTFGDIANFVINAGTIVFTVLTIWNPIGWVAAVLGLIGLIFSGRNKKAEAKQKMRENLLEAKAASKQKYDQQISAVVSKLDAPLEALIESLGQDQQNLEKLKDFVSTAEENIQKELMKLKELEYGKI